MFKNCCGCQNTKQKKKQQQISQDEKKAVQTEPPKKTAAAPAPVAAKPEQKKPPEAQKKPVAVTVTITDTSEKEEEEKPLPQQIEIIVDSVDNEITEPEGEAAATDSTEPPPVEITPPEVVEEPKKSEVLEEKVKEEVVVIVEEPKTTETIEIQETKEAQVTKETKETKSTQDTKETNDTKELKVKKDHVEEPKKPEKKDVPSPECKEKQEKTDKPVITEKQEKKEKKEKTETKKKSSLKLTKNKDKDKANKEKDAAKSQTPEEKKSPVIETTMKPKVSKDSQEETGSTENLVAISKEIAKDLLSAGAIFSGSEIIPRGNAATPHPSKRGASLGALPQWLSQEDDDVFELGGNQEPPATPVAKEDLALRRHRFFSELVTSNQANSEHRVRFDPMGPTVAAAGSDLEKECDLVNSTTKLATLINRLEVVTQRLEEGVAHAPHCSIRTSLSDGCVTVAKGVTTHSGSAPVSVTSIASQTGTAAGVIDDIPQTSVITLVVDAPDSRENEQLSISLAAYDSIINGPLSVFLKLSTDIGGEVAAQAEFVEAAFRAQKAFLSHTSSATEPALPSDLLDLLQPTSTAIQDIQQHREKNRTSAMFNHLSAVSESIPALGWVTVVPTPAPFVREMTNAGEFYTNRVLKEFKEEEEVHAEWVKTWLQILCDLERFIKHHHTTGLVWEGKSSEAPSPPLPPPPESFPPPPPIMPPEDVAPLDNTTDWAAVFEDINRGESLTCLKKVTPDMQIHKNPALRNGPAPFKVPSPSPVTKPVSAPKSIEKSPVFAKDGTKWIIENQKGNHSLIIEGAEMNNMVNMYNCQDSTLVVNGKVNRVMMSACKRTFLVFDALISSVDFINCLSVEMQVLDKVPTINIDKTDGCKIYLSENSMDVEIISSRSSEMNIMIPEDNGDYVEYMLPNQFKTTVTIDGLTTVPCVTYLIK